MTQPKGKPKPENLSVVKEGDSSNYNLSRGGLSSSDLDYVNQLDKTLSNPPTGPLPVKEMFPTAGRPIRVGQVSSKTLGSVPLFAAGQGLLPVGIIQAKKQAEYKASMERFAMFGPENNDIYDQYVELANPMAQDEFNAKLQGEINDLLDETAAALGGDYGKARMAVKHMPAYKNLINTYKNYGRGYNFLFGQAMQVIQDAQDPTKYTDEETVEMAIRFFKNHDDLSTKDIRELEGYINKFRSHMSIDAIAQSTLAGLGERVTTRIEERVGTEGNAVFETIQTKGFYTDTEINQMVDDTIESFPWIKNDPEARGLLKRKIKKGISYEVNRAIQAVRRDYNTKKTQWSTHFGVSQNPETGEWHGSKMQRYTTDGKTEYTTEYANIPAKVKTESGGMQNVKLDLVSNEHVTIKDHDGNVKVGYFNVLFNDILPQRMYKDESGELQMLSIIDANITQPKLDAWNQPVPGVQRGAVMFNIVGGDVLDVVDMAGRYEIIMSEEQVKSQMMGYFDENGWNKLVEKAKGFKVTGIKDRETAKRFEFFTMTEGKGLTDENKKKTRAEYAKKSEESGIQYIILDDVEYYNSVTDEWDSYDEAVTAFGSREAVEKAIEQGQVRYK